MSEVASRAPTSGKFLWFDAFRLDTTRGALWTGEREVVLRPKTAAVLGHLLAHAGEVVSREALLDAIWPDVAVTDDSVTQCVSEIRRALGEHGPRLLQTLPRRGYRLVTELRTEQPPADPPPASPAPPRLSRWTLAGGVPLLLGLGLMLWLWLAPSPPDPSPAAVATPAAMAEALLEQGRARLRGTGTYEVRLRESLPIFLQASELDPRLAAAAAEAAFVHANLITSRLSADPVADLAEAERYARLAQAAAPDDPFAIHARAVVLRHQGRFAEALPLYRAAGQDPGRITARAGVGLMLLLLGDARQAIEPLQAMLVEAPFHPFVGTWRTYLGLAKLFAGVEDLGAEDFALPPGVRSFMPQDERLLYRLAALVQAGRDAEAAALDRDLKQRVPGLLAQAQRAPALSSEPAYLALREAYFLAPLRRIGWAE